jgi:hypothetical protein
LIGTLPQSAGKWTRSASVRSWSSPRWCSSVRQPPDSIDHHEPSHVN